LPDPESGGTVKKLEEKFAVLPLNDTLARLIFDADDDDTRARSAGVEDFDVPV
jgi:hypothetical protein